MKEAIERLSKSFEDFASELNELADDLPKCNKAGHGEQVDDHYRPQPARERDRGGVHDETQITLKSGDLRKVVDAYRKLSRLAREGKVANQEQRFEGHRAVKAVKHLIRKPRKDRH